MEATDTTVDTADTVTTEVSGAVSAVVDLAEGSENNVETF
jgi:hypothetical protein